MIVASVPARHAYTRRIGLPGDGVTRVATPAPSYRAATMVSAGWVEAHAPEFDCFHTHFGFGDVPVDQLRRWRRALATRSRPLVHTVHDIWNPHVADQDHHLAQVGFLVGTADAVVTLTERAADVVQARWGRRPEVIPHPPLLEGGPEPRPPRARCRVGLHLKDGRPALPGVEEVTGLVRRLGDDPRFELELRAYPSLRHRRPALAAALDAGSRRPSVEVRWEPYATDEDFARCLRDLDVAVLAYRYGTHSGWAEACLDVGTRVVAPPHTCIPDQDPGIASVDMAGEDGLDRLVALLRAWAEAPPATVDRAGRARRRREVARAHARLYRSVLGG